jgi:N-acetylglutamate synthase-like GNAT family acetyltransferase
MRSVSAGRKAFAAQTQGVIQGSSVIAISSYTASMQQRVVDLILTIQRDEFGFDIRAEDQPDLLAVADFYQTGAGGFWVALADDEVVGTIALRDIGNGQGALRKMFVRATHRGKEHGVASRLLEQLVLSATGNRLRELYLGTTEKFVAAHRFYEKNAFIRVEASVLPQAFPRMSLDTRFYRRALSAGARPGADPLARSGEEASPDPDPLPQAVEGASRLPLHRTLGGLG